MQTPHIDKLGFVRVPSEPQAQAGAKPQVSWLQCNECGKRERFWVAEDQVRCSCGAVYDHAAVEGRQVPVAELTWVPFKEGPVSMQELEMDWKRIALLAGFVLAAAGLLFWLL